MKKGFAIIILAFFLIQCKKDLHWKQTGFTPMETAIHDLESGQLALNGCYRLHRGEFTGGVEDVIYWVELPGYYSGDLDPRNFGVAAYSNYFSRNLRADNTLNRGFWGLLYRVINACNNVIHEVERLHVDPPQEAEQKRILGEARFLRALQYLYLVQFYGEVPMPLQFTGEPDAPPLSASTIEEIYHQIEKDLIYASNHVQGPQLYYVSRSAARTLMARMYLYREEWQKALDTAEAVIQSGHFSLNKDFSLIFTQPGNREGIFYISYDPGFNRLYLAFKNRFVTLGTDLNDLYNSKDQRRNITFSGTRVMKYQNEKLNDPVYEMRHAEVLLIAAEAAGELGNFNKTNTYYEMIRKRAGISAPILDAGNFKDSLLTERHRELIGEGAHRFIDVKRMGKAQELWGLPQYKELWPIPQQELDENPLMVQNPGY